MKKNKHMDKENNNYKEQEALGQQYSFTLFKPGGNDTCLYNGIVLDPIKRKELNDLIMGIYPNIEQVGFIDPNPLNPELMMAGGEFCGNATRSTAWAALKGQPGAIDIRVSGVQDVLSAGVKENGDAFAQMPIYEDPTMISEYEDGSYIVRMEGITQFITPAPDNLSALSQDEIKIQAREKMRELGIDEDPAAGVMYMTNNESGLSLVPIVYVRDIDTLFYESACGSGTTAVGMVVAKNTNSSIEIPIMQPSGLAITIKVDFDGKFNYAEISGPIEKLVSGRIEKGQTYAIEEIEDKDQLARLLGSGELTALYNEVFGGPPYFESFSDEEVVAEFTNYLENGFVSIARSQGKIIGFEGTCRASASSVAGIIEQQGLDPNSLWYFGDLGVSEEFRRKGIGREMTKQRLAKLSDSVVLRTNRNNLRAISLYKSLGFRNKDGWSQDVTQLRTDGTIQEDERIFLLKEKNEK